VLVLGVPIIDTLWAVMRRLAKRTSPFRADKKHFHHLLLDAGMSQRQAVLTVYAGAVIFGVVALMSDSMGKLVALAALVFVMAAAIGALIFVGWVKRRKLIPKEPLDKLVK
jgi:UDP-GlcNAc:undecaprenyl-phosphate GlcNAc-1-phosphate transferase